MTARGAQKMQLPASSLQAHCASLSGQRSDACSETCSLEMTTLAKLGTQERMQQDCWPPTRTFSDPALPPNDYHPSAPRGMTLQWDARSLPSHT